jgi:hypothetical protein
MSLHRDIFMTKTISVEGHLGDTCPGFRLPLLFPHPHRTDFFKKISLKFEAKTTPRAVIGGAIIWK